MLTFLWSDVESSVLSLRREMALERIASDFGTETARSILDKCTFTNLFDFALFGLQQPESML